MSPALLTAQALSPALKPSQGSSPRSRICGVEPAGASASGSRAAGEGGVRSSSFPSALISQAHGLWDIERAGNLLFRCLLLENSSNLLKLKLLMGMLVWETESPGPVSWSISHLSPLAGTSMGRSVPILTRNRKVLDPQTAQNKWVFQPALPTPPASTAPAVRASSAQPGRWYSSNWKAGL